MIKYCIVLLLTFPLFSSAQTDVSLGAPYRVIDGSKYYFKKGNEAMAVKFHKDEIFIQKFDVQKLSFVKVRTYDDLPKNFEIEKIAEYNGRYFFFYSVWDKSNEKEQLFSREINFNDGSFIAEGKLLISVDGKITRNSGNDKFYFEESRDHSKMLIKFRLKPEVKNDEKSFDIIGLYIYNKNLELLSGKKFKMPYTEKKMDNIDYSVDSKGNAYILSIVFNDNTTDIKKNKKDEKANYHIELLTIKFNSDLIDITPIAVNEKFINKVWLFESPSNFMICAGFYNIGKDLDNANGIFVFKIGEDNKSYDMASYEIPVEILNMYASAKTKRKNTKKEEDDKAEFTDLELMDLIIMEDGSILLIGEQYYVVQHSTYNAATKSYTTYYSYHYNDMLITKIDPKGRLSWMKKLPKRQSGLNGKGGMSYKYLASDDKHYFLFLDNEKNMSLPVDEVPAQHKDGAGGFLTAYCINNLDGGVKKISLLDTRDVKGTEVYQVAPSRILPTASNEFIMEVYKKKKEDILIKVGLPK